MVDVNNFYVSCERLFNPSLMNQPVVVLSNNDGCIISRSNEAKSLGIKMGEPLFKAKPIIQKYHVKVLSSNYPLYADMSNRVMRVLSAFTEQQEVYSIDECFLNMSGHKNLLETGFMIKNTLSQWLGMPVCVGIGPSKVVAKFANHCAKKQQQWQGVFSSHQFLDGELNELMASVDVGEIWGVGRKLAQRLIGMGIHSVLDLKQANANYMKRQFSINMERIVLELNGIQCFALESDVKPRKEIIASRSFGRRVECYNELVEAITTFVARASRKARQQSSVCGAVSVFIRSSPFNSRETFYANSGTLSLNPPTNNSTLILKAALEILSGIYKSGIKYSKCGVILSGLADVNTAQHDLWSESSLKKESLTQMVDQINDRFNKNSLRIATQPIHPIWGMKQSLKSRSFTTAWDQLLVAD